MLKRFIHWKQNKNRSQEPAWQKHRLDRWSAHALFAFVRRLQRHDGLRTPQKFSNVI